MNKQNILKDALDSRNQEIMEYQINIDNYVRAIKKITVEYADNTAMIKFQDHLTDMLAAHKTEQLKAIIIRDVILDQLTEMEES
jgi:hypothetical protein